MDSGTGKAPLNEPFRNPVLTLAPLGRYALMSQNRNKLVASPMPMQALEQFEKRIHLFEQIVGKNIEKRVRLIEQHFEEKVERPFRRSSSTSAAISRRGLRRFEQKNGIRLDDEVRFIGSWIKKPLVDRRRHAVEQGARPRHGALCRSRRRRAR